MLIALTNVKGGCAKSTTAVHLCHWLARKGKSVGLIDADAQMTSAMWLNALGADGITVCSIDPEPDPLYDKAGEFASKFDFVVIDGPGGLLEVVRAALFSCDLALIPIQATGPDVRASGDALKLLRRCRDVRGGLPPAHTFLTRVNPRTTAYRGARATLSEQQIAPLLNGMICARQVVQDGYNSSQTSFSHGTGPGLEAANEFNALFSEILPNV